METASLRYFDYEESKRLACHADPAERLQLARRSDVRPEILYYLAEDNQATVRRAIAANNSTPVQADAILARDDDDGVRCALAQRIAAVFPGLTSVQHARVREQMIEVLQQLANDQLAEIRAHVANSIKAADNVPHELALKLARDVEETVSVPVLRHSPLLTDDDLVELVAHAASSGALEAIASREELHMSVSEAVAGTMEPSAVAALLANRTARLREETLDQLIAQAEDIESWHEPLAMRVDLSYRAMKKIAGFVAASLVEKIVEGNEMPQEVRSSLISTMQKKLSRDASVTIAAGASSEDDESEVERRIAKLLRGKKLNEKVLARSVKNGEKLFVTHALAALAGIDAAVAKRIIATGRGKPVTSLVWKAGFSMRSAMEIQKKIAKVPHREFLNARNGIDYPLSQRDMEWQISFFAD